MFKNITYALAFLFLFCEYDQAQKKRHLVEIEMTRKTEELVRMQEEVLGITHQGSPAVKISLWGDAGEYHPPGDTIYLNVSEFGSLRMKEIIDHELGHFYVDKRAEFLGLDDFLRPLPDGILPCDTAERVKIFEGVAEYFRMALNRDPHDLPKKYVNAFDFVYPAISKLGLQGGVDALLKRCVQP